METSSMLAKNPWTDDERTFGTIRNAIFLAEKTNHIFSEQEQWLVADKKEGSTSLRVIQHLKDIDEKKRDIAKVNLEIQKRLWHRETRDLTHLNTLERRIKRVNELSSHIQNLVSHKDKLILLLQQPYIGEFIKIEASYKQYVSDFFPKIVPILGEMSIQLNNIQWASQVDFNDGHLDSLLSEVTATLATLQSSVQSFLQMRYSIQQIRDCSYDLANSSYSTGPGH